MIDIPLNRGRKAQWLTVGELIAKLSQLKNLNEHVLVCADPEGNRYGTVYCVTKETTMGGDCVMLYPGIVQELRNKGRGKRRDLLNGVIDLLVAIQEQAADEYNEETVCGAFECSSCGERTDDGHAHHGSFYCEECWARSKVRA